MYVPCNIRSIPLPHLNFSTLNCMLHTNPPTVLHPTPSLPPPLSFSLSLARSLSPPTMCAQGYMQGACI